MVGSAVYKVGRQAVKGGGWESQAVSTPLQYPPAIDTVCGLLTCTCPTAWGTPDSRVTIAWCTAEARKKNLLQTGVRGKG